MRRLPFFVAVLLLLAALCPSAQAEMVPVRKIRVGLPPFSVLEEATRHNDLNVTARQEGTALPPLIAPHLTWLADSDMRQQADQFYPDAAEKVYIVRSPGGLFSPVAASIDFGINELHTPLLLITAAAGNSRAMPNAGPEANAAAWADLPQKYAAMQANKSRPSQQLQAITTDPFLASAEQGVDAQVAAAGNRYRERIANGRLVVVGAVIDLADRYGLGPGRLVIININGETDPVKLREMSHLVRLEPRLLDMVGRRQSVKATKDATKPQKSDKKKAKSGKASKTTAKDGKGKIPPKKKGKTSQVAPQPETEEDNPEKPAYEFKY